MSFAGAGTISEHVHSSPFDAAPRRRSRQRRSRSRTSRSWQATLRRESLHRRRRTRRRFPSRPAAEPARARTRRVSSECGESARGAAGNPCDESGDRQRRRRALAPSARTSRSQPRAGRRIRGARSERVDASPEISASVWPSGVETTSSSRGGACCQEKFAVEAFMPRRTDKPAVDRERRVDRRAMAERRRDRRGRARCEQEAPPTARRPSTPGARTPTATARTGASSRAAPDCRASVFNCDCHTSRARARSPFAHNTSPRCAAISASGRSVERAPQIGLGGVEIAHAGTAPSPCCRG